MPCAAKTLRDRHTMRNPQSVYEDDAFNAIDWKRVCHLLLLSRAIDDLEESQLVPAKKVFNQFSARGHDFAQILLGSQLTHPHDGASGYYRSRPFVLSLGLTAEDALAAPMAKSGGYSDGRDIGVVCNFPGNGELGPGCSLLPMSGGVGAQYTPVAGWAQGIAYHRDVLKNDEWAGAAAVSLGGDASLSTNGFWSALNIATTNNLPYLFYVEDNGYGISVPAEVQTPGGDHVQNLASWKNLKIIDGDGTDPEVTPQLVCDAVEHIRRGEGACLLRLKVPRLCGHTFQDTQTYKDEAFIEAEQERDPLPRLKQFVLSKNIFSETSWKAMEKRVAEEVRDAALKAEARPEPDPANLQRHVFFESPSIVGREPESFDSIEEPQPEGQRINMLSAIRRTLDAELQINPHMLVFGEDVGPKGGVHAATMGLADKHGDRRVFDTSLSEEGIMGRSAGLALTGLLPVPEIQFRKYAEPAAEQITDIGTMRWRTNNRFSAPVVMRVPGGFAKRGDPWHSMCDEVEWAHKVGWQVVMPSNAEDAVGLLRTALRNPNPTVFFEHRHLYDASWARRPYPGDAYVVPFGKASRAVEGNRLTIVAWGAMVERADEVASASNGDIEVIDLRTLVPWDKEAVFASVRKTGRCMVVHEDNRTAGFGAEIVATLTDELFWELDAPIKRLTMEDIPNPHNIHLLEAAVPSVEKIAATAEALLKI